MHICTHIHACVWHTHMHIHTARGIQHCMYVCIYMYINTHIHMYICYTNIHACIVCTHAHSTWIHTFSWYISVYMYKYTHLCICVYIYTYKYTYKYTYIHAYTHIYSHLRLCWGGAAWQPFPWGGDLVPACICAYIWICVLNTWLLFCMREITHSIARHIHTHHKYVYAHVCMHVCVRWAREHKQHA